MVSISSQEDFLRREHHLLAHCLEKTSPQTLPQYTIHSFYCKKYAAVSSLSLSISLERIQIAKKCILFRDRRIDLLIYWCYCWPVTYSCFKVSPWNMADFF